MTIRLVAVLAGLGVFPGTLAWCAEEAFPHSLEVTSTERVQFSPGGAIRLNDSYGYTSIDGWDQPQVEIKVIKSTNRFFNPSEEEEAKQKLALIHVTTERVSETELSITAARPLRKDRVPPLPRTVSEGVTVELQIHVPNDSRLTIHQDNGYVWVSDVTGDIEARSHTGDMIVMLPDPGPYAIDAKTRLGSISSDFAGSGVKRFVVGSRFASSAEGASRRVYLRMGRGSITIKQAAPPASPSHN
jgi:hypothetical protein